MCSGIRQNSLRLQGKQEFNYGPTPKFGTTEFLILVAEVGLVETANPRERSVRIAAVSNAERHYVFNRLPATSTRFFSQDELI